MSRPCNAALPACRNTLRSYAGLSGRIRITTAITTPKGATMRTTSDAFTMRPTCRPAVEPLPALQARLQRARRSRPSRRSRLLVGVCWDAPVFTATVSRVATREQNCSCRECNRSVDAEHAQARPRLQRVLLDVHRKDLLACVAGQILADRVLPFLRQCAHDPR